MGSEKIRVFPRRNLPDSAENWGRDVEARISELVKDNDKLKSALANLSRSVNGVGAALSGVRAQNRAVMLSAQGALELANQAQTEAARAQETAQTGVPDDSLTGWRVFLADGTVVDAAMNDGVLSVTADSVQDLYVVAPPLRVSNGHWRVSVEVRALLDSTSGSVELGVFPVAEGGEFFPLTAHEFVPFDHPEPDEEYLHPDEPVEDTNPVNWTGLDATHGVGAPHLLSVAVRVPSSLTAETTVETPGTEEGEEPTATPVTVPAPVEFRMFGMREVTALENARNEIATDMAELDQALTANEQKIADAEDVLDGVSSDLDELHTVTLPALRTDLDDLDFALDANEVRLDTLVDTDLPALQAQVTAVEGGVELADKRLTISTEAPSATAGYPDGAQWIRLDGSNAVIGSWVKTALGWVTTTLSPTIIPVLDAGKITSGVIDTARLNANEIAASVATVIELNASRITTGTLNTARLNASEVAAAVATVIQLNADRITSGTIATARLNATEIAASVATIISLDASRITSGTIAAGRIAALSITADKLLIGSGENLQPDPTFLSATVWPSFRSGTGGQFGGGSILFPAGSTARLSLSSYHIPVTPYDSYRVKVYVAVGASAANNVGVRVRFYNSAGTQVSVESITLPGTSGWLEGVVTAPVNGVTARLEPFVNAAHTTTARFSSISTTRAMDSSLIVDGAVTARALNVVSTSAEGSTLTLQSDGLRIWEEAEGDPDIELTTSSQGFSLRHEDGGVASSLSRSGAVSGREGVFDTLRVGGRDIAEVVARESTSRVVGRGSVLTDVRPIVSEYGLIEVGYQERPGHLYRLDWSASWSARVAGDRAQFRFRRSAVDGAVTITSEELVNSRAVTIAERADLSRTDVGLSLFEGTQEGWRRILMTIARRSGSGQLDMNSRTVVDFPPVYMIITEVGENVPDTGRANSGGGVLYNTPAPPAPPSAKTAFDRTFTATGFNSYAQSGGTPSNPGLTNPIQGRSPYFTAVGSQYSKIYFDSGAIQAQLSGAESIRAWAYINMEHWHSSAGGHARLQLLNSNGSLGHWGDIRFSARGQGRWVELGPAQVTAFATGTWVGLGLSGMGSTSTDHYGYASWSDRPKLRFTGLK